MNIQKEEALKTLYAQQSKHSNYQILSKRLSSIISNDEIAVKTRYEQERLKYILENISIKNKTVLDIGGNTGFFTFELLDHGAKSVHYYEGNKHHTDFVSLASKVLNVQDEIKVTNGYFSFEAEELPNEKQDIILLLNVLHHLGDDFGSNDISIENAKTEIIIKLNALSDKTSFLAFQLGFNWKGDAGLPLFEKGTKKELIDFITKGISDHWEIIEIGIPEFTNNKINYVNLNKNNINRNDQLGEFLNRPLFIMKSIK